MQRKYTISIIALIVVVLILVPSYIYISNYNDGVIKFSAADSPITEGISGVYITFSQIEMHSNNSGWLDFSIPQTTINIFNFTINNPAFIASLNIPSGRYTMMRVYIKSVSVDLMGNNITLNLSSHWGFVNHPLVILAHSTSNVVLEFNLNECININSKIFTPYIGVFIS